MLNRTFENPYVRELSIQDHCHEINVLYDELRVLKAQGRDGKAFSVWEAIKKEQMDLCLILMEHFGIDVLGVSKEYANLYERRLEKFQEKERNNG